GDILAGTNSAVLLLGELPPLGNEDLHQGLGGARNSAFRHAFLETSGLAAEKDAALVEMRFAFQQRRKCLFVGVGVGHGSHEDVGD
ncbi:hypothetical protein ADL26_17865, partial [Thermoactinomyces vulgaris]